MPQPWTTPMPCGSRKPRSSTRGTAEPPIRMRRTGRRVAAALRICASRPSQTVGTPQPAVTPLALHQLEQAAPSRCGPGRRASRRRSARYRAGPRHSRGTAAPPAAGGPAAYSRTPSASRPRRARAARSSGCCRARLSDCPSCPRCSRGRRPRSHRASGQSNRRRLGRRSDPHSRARPGSVVSGICAASVMTITCSRLGMRAASVSISGTKVRSTKSSRSAA